LKNVGISHRPQAADHGVDRDHQRGEQDRGGEVDAHEHVEAGADRDQQFRAPEDLGEHGGHEQHGGPVFAET
jgi:hypothetical protein